MDRGRDDVAMPNGPSRPRLVILVALALSAFAANSVLCRLALGTGSLDAASFTAIRLSSGAAVLALIVALRSRGASGPRRSRGARDRIAAAMLFIYASGFSFAYLALDTGTGALILFGTVQVTMFAVALFGSARPKVAEWIGLAVAGGGLVWLVAPGDGAPSLTGALLMAAAGVGWGGYTLLGRRPGDPVARTSRSFGQTVPATIVLLAATGLTAGLHADPRGVMLALASGIVTSGIGYAIWYAALPGLTASRAALLQLLVPVLAAIAGVVLLNEPVTPRLILGGGLIVAGIFGSIIGRR